MNMGVGRGISVAEIVKHASPEDCWMVVNGKVYDLTNFAPNHPGGADVIYKYSGKDATATYNTYHAADLITSTLPPAEQKGDFDESTITDTWRAAAKDETRSAPADPNAKPPLSSLLNLHDFEEAFSRHGDAKAWAYIWAGSNDQLTLAANKQRWNQLWFRPRIMRDVRSVSTVSTLCGAKVQLPVFISPMGIAKTAGAEGEAGLGAGAAAAGMLHCLAGTTSSMTYEEVLRAVPKDYPYLFQLYVNQDRNKTAALLQQLERVPQIRAIFVTADLAVVSKREADERLKTPTAGGSVDKKGGGLARTTGSFIDPALNWEDIAWLRKQTSKKLFVKGIQSAADAKLAVYYGCSGIVVSNHGGRALDSAPGTIGVLLEIRRDAPEVFGKLEVLIDGGIRRGSDVLKAVLLGAQGVGIGRPFQCALSYGREGVQTACEIILDELETSMRLCGITDLDAARGKMEYLNTSELEQYLPPPPPSSSQGWFSRWWPGSGSKL